jgi:hypothetical protein
MKKAIKAPKVKITYHKHMFEKRVTAYNGIEPIGSIFVSDGGIFSGRLHPDFDLTIMVGMVEYLVKELNKKKKT